MTDREKFEAYYASLWPETPSECVKDWWMRQDEEGCYDDIVEPLWLAWQASRNQALEEAREALNWIADRAHKAHMTKSKDVDDWGDDMELIAWKARVALGILSKAESK